MTTYDLLGGKLEVEGSCEVERGPLGRFVDLCREIEDEGLTVPPEIKWALIELQKPQE